MKLPGIAAEMADGADDFAIVTVEDPHHVVRPIGIKQVFLLRIRREGELKNPRASLCGHSGQKELLHELALFREHLDAVASSIADYAGLLSQAMLGETGINYSCQPRSCYTPASKWGSCR